MLPHDLRRILFRREAALASAWALGLAACWAPETTPRSEAVLEAAYRHLITYVPPAGSPDVDVFCVGLGQGADSADPPVGLLTLLADIDPPVRPVSACSHGAMAHAGIDDHAAIVSVVDLRCADPAHCAFRGGYQDSDSGESWGSFVATRRAGAWRIAAEPAANDWLDAPTGEDRIVRARRPLSRASAPRG